MHHPSSLTRLHILDALDRCADAGISLEFSRLDLSDIGAAAAEELALIGNGILGKDNTVERYRTFTTSLNFCIQLHRVTFGHNRLAALPTEFALLSSLRYLNLKYNCFTVFPEVVSFPPLLNFKVTYVIGQLTLLISLDTLDISHNKIRRLPSYPGQLVNLRVSLVLVHTGVILPPPHRQVLSLSRNKLSHLPPYLAKFHRLDVLQADKNPIEWPPKIVMEALNQPMPGMSMKDRIHYLQNWIESNGRETKMRAEYDVQGEKDVYVFNCSSFNISQTFLLYEIAILSGGSPFKKLILMLASPLMLAPFLLTQIYRCLQLLDLQVVNKHCLDPHL